MPTTDQIALVTGATSGLGREVAKALAAQGLHVLAHGRNARRTEALVEELVRAGGSAQPYVADLASLAQVRDLAERVSADHPALHVLVNNAGVGGGPPPRRTRELSEDGHEMRWAVNYLAPALLTRLLLPALTAAAPSRVVNVTSTGQAEVDFDDTSMERGYDGAEAYFRSKFALAAFTFDLADQLKGSGVTVNCLHPATFMDTFQVREAGFAPWNTVEAGVPPVLNLAVDKTGGEVTGQYFDGMRKKKAHRKAYKGDVQRRLREVTDRQLAPYTGGRLDGQSSR
ncbi:SDR family NAD(P)-dependent oxidoreductase [Allostreptomyces psammosilenae]|uniref:NAD(P)-dependent dehydrogenase (Short-subunit alcohol dehydrogenase family) n=1 Tax=Allostreptomyces psammosilenae TaxID=1892865 RepID=A0A852ZR88_9ACTN|nr:SDR family NAD(P)-dependent oxidoreductase [Allostreptomyces psammosilenae]NYI04913.1 NAD(P)-dependent dehydrogenase (short-subunit alcohol dehydrogenase family) [Allostreptomyces psammosilenae]